MTTFDVVLHTSEDSFRSNSQQEWISSPPVKERVVLAPGLWLGQLPSDLARTLMDTCDPTLLGVEGQAKFAQCYCYIRELPDTAELRRHCWDQDHRLLTCVGLSRLIHPTTVGFRYAARIRHDNTPESVKIVPAEIRGISIDGFVSPNRKRKWLTKSDAGQLAELVTKAEPLLTPSFPMRISRALWYFDYAQRTCYDDLRWTLVATALESLVHTGKGGSTKHFTNRVPALATEVGAKPLTADEAGLAWNFRSRLSHGDGFLFAMPNADIALYDKLEETLRLAILKAFLEPAFANVFTNDGEIAKRWPA